MKFPPNTPLATSRNSDDLVNEFDSKPYTQSEMMLAVNREDNCSDIWKRKSHTHKSELQLNIAYILCVYSISRIFINEIDHFPAYFVDDRLHCTHLKFRTIAIFSILNIGNSYL